MHSGRKIKTDYIDVIANIIMVLFSISILYPMLHVVAVSLSEKGPIVSNSVTIFPIGFTLESYTYFVDHDQFLTGFVNGVLYTVEGVFANLVATALMAYPMSKAKLIGRATIMKLCVFTMTAPLLMEMLEMILELVP